MPTSQMTALAEAVIHSGTAFRRDHDLPLPNIYFSSVYRVTGEAHHCYLAADFTGSALQKLQRWCLDSFGFRPYPSNCAIKMRRLKLGDLIENPGAYDQALARAQALGEADVVARLEAMPAFIAAKVGHPLPPARVDAQGAATALWRRFAGELSKLG
ncbi:hypothetical protein D3C85_664720 [compost metagenome]